MKTLSDCHKFIELRSEGYSYRKISDILGISKDTCVEWNKQFSNEITELTNEKTEELLIKYNLSKISRLISFGKTLSKINQALENVLFETIEAKDLLELKLKYTLLLNKDFKNIEIKADSHESKEINLINSYFQKSDLNSSSISIEIIDTTDESRISKMESELLKPD